MVTKKRIEGQLKRLGVTVRVWGAAECDELCHILTDHEEITAYVHGWYESGFATLVATSERLLLVDKKLFNLTIEDVRYDMIAEVDYNARLMDATVRINTLNKVLRFTSMKHRHLRHLTTYVQHRVMQLRSNQAFTWQQFEQTPMPQYGGMMNNPAFMPQPASPQMPLQAPQLSPMRRFTTSNPYKTALTTKSTRHAFLPKVPRRFRPN